MSGKSAENYYILKREGRFDGTVNLDVNGRPPRITDGAETPLAADLGLQAGRPGYGEDGGHPETGGRPEEGLAGR